MILNSKKNAFSSQTLKLSFISSLVPLEPLNSFSKQKEGDLISIRHTTVEGNITKKNNKFFAVAKHSKLSEIILNNTKPQTKKNKHVRCRSYNGDRTLSQSLKFNRISLITPQKAQAERSPNITNRFPPLSLSLFDPNGLRVDSKFLYKKPKKDKGGKVDLATSSNSKYNSNTASTSRYSSDLKEKLTFRKTSPCRTITFSKYKVPLAKKENSAKLIQNWWRRLNFQFKPLKTMIIKIQSVWRGFYLRKYVFDVIYLTLFCQNFCDKIKDVLGKIAKRENFPKLFGRNYTKFDQLKLAIIHNERERPKRNIDILKKRYRTFVWNTVYKQGNFKSALVELSKITFLLEQLIKRKENTKKIENKMNLLKYFYRWGLINKNEKNIFLNNKAQSKKLNRLFKIYEKNNINFLIDKYLFLWKNKGSVVNHCYTKGFSLLNTFFLQKLILYLNYIQRVTKFNQKMKKKFKKENIQETYNAFRKWTKNADKLKEKQIKGYLCKNIKQGKERIKKINQLYQYFYKWMKYRPQYFRSSEKELKNKIKKLIKSIKILANNWVFKKLKFLFSSPQKFSKILIKFEKHGYFFLYPYYTKWKVLIQKINLEVRKIQKLFLSLSNNEKMEKVLIYDKGREFINCLNEVNQLKKRKAKIISIFLNSIKQIKKNNTFLKRNSCLRKLVKKNLRGVQKNLLSTLYYWKKYCRYYNTNLNTIIIQKFIKNKLFLLNKKREGYKTISKMIIDNYIHGVFNLIKDTFLSLLSKEHKERRKKKLALVLQNLILKHEKILRHKFLQCYNQSISLKHTEKIIKIQNFFRKKQSIKKYNILIQIKTNLIKKILLKDKLLSLQLSLFLKRWKREVMMEEKSKKVEIIQKYFRKKLKGLKIRKLQRLILKCSVKKTINFLDTLAHSPDIVKVNKATEMCKALNKVYIRQPRYHLMNALRWLMRIKCIKQLYRKIPDCLTAYFYPLYFNRWKEKTAKDTFNKIIKIQRSAKKYLKQIRMNKQIDFDQFLRKYLHKKQNNIECNEIVILKKWKRKSIYLTLLTYTLKIQRNFKLLLQKKNQRIKTS